MARRENIKNLAASIKERLRQAAQKQGIDFNRALLLYMQEGFLRRLSQSPYKERFVLKGGILFYGQFERKARPTKDIDFLVTNTGNSSEKLEAIFKIICAQPSADGIRFDGDRIDIQEIKEDADYHGLRIKIRGTLGTMVLPLQIDIGFGDVLKPESIVFDYPVLLDERPFQLVAYSWDSVIAEKFEAIVNLGEANSRYKDFYDLYFLSRTLKFSGSRLAMAIGETFRHRGTELKDYTTIFYEAFVTDAMKVKMWASFRRKMRLEENLEFADIVHEIEYFLLPVIQSLLKRTDCGLEWIPEEKVWR